jgi:hypothetical protein
VSTSDSLIESTILATSLVTETIATSGKNVTEPMFSDITSTTPFTASGASTIPVATPGAAVTASQLLGHLDQLLSDKPVLAVGTTAVPLTSDNETAHALLSALRSHVAEHNLIGSQLITNLTEHLASADASDISEQEKEATKSRLRELIR